MAPPDLDPRRQLLWRMQDFAQGRGLEVGPLYDPIVRRGEGDVRYVDVQDQAGLRRYYADHPGIPLESIPEIDYTLIKADGRTVSLVEAARSGAPFDWVVASHVVEHIPDLIGWLAELAELVVDGGSMVLVVPDRRFTFDVHRPPTTVGQILEAHHEGARRPGIRAVYDHYSSAVDYNVSDLWNGVLPTFANRCHPSGDVREWMSKAVAGEYVDSHVWLFTPDSFVEQMRELRGDRTVVLVRRRDGTDRAVRERVPGAAASYPQDAGLAPGAGRRGPARRRHARLAGRAGGRPGPTRGGAGRPEPGPRGVQERLRRRVERLAARSEQQQARLRARDEQLLRRDRTIARLRSALESRDQELTAIRTSRRWRLASAVATAPAAVGRLVRRQGPDEVSEPRPDAGSQGPDATRDPPGQAAPGGQRCFCPVGPSQGLVGSAALTPHAGPGPLQPLLDPSEAAFGPRQLSSGLVEVPAHDPMQVLHPAVGVGTGLGQRLLEMRDAVVALAHADFRQKAPAQSTISIGSSIPRALRKSSTALAHAGTAP